MYQGKDKITAIKGIGSQFADKLNRLGIETVSDLLRHYPSRYFDFTHPVKINQIRPGSNQVFAATLGKVSTFFSKNGKLITQVTAKDSTGKITLSWFNNPYIKKLIKENSVYTVAGKATFWGNGLTIVAPFIETGDKPTINTSGLVPIYPLTKGVSSKWLRTKINTLLLDFNTQDPLPDKLIKPLSLVSLKTANQNIHFPKAKEFLYSADKRLSFNEHLRINIDNQLNLKNLGDSISVKINPKLYQKTLKNLSFKLTPDQNKTVSSIFHDLTSKDFTHRLIQGDTGSGKTATIIVAADQCLDNNLSCALMAPTEILASQHFKTFSASSSFPRQIQLVTATTQKNISFDKPSVYIGTHSLLTNLPQKLNYPLAFVTIDEQHKFGVKQRDQLVSRKPIPHLFNLSATPIPRTVALGLLGDITISNITHKPTNRLPTKTFVVTPSHFKKSPDWLREQLEKGSQIYVVCPNIQDHNTGVASVEKIAHLYKNLAKNDFPVFSLHGKMKSEEQNKTIETFKQAGGGVLVSTSLIEVGLDIPSANVMIIHSAERFGLASLHQLRGRIGRGEEQGFCFLVPSTDDEEETERLQLLKKFHSGVTLARKDLHLRGAGEVFGIRQHGSLPTRLRYFWSKKLFLEAKQIAKTLVNKNSANAKLIASRLTTC